MEPQPPYRALGKGLSALLPEPTAASGERLMTVGLAEIRPNRRQPRVAFPQGELEELATSMKQKGVLQPLMVRPRGGQYELIAGERRWRAAQLAGLDKVPVIVRDVSDAEALQLSLIENLQREDLNAMETAQAFERLVQEFHWTQEQVAQAVAKDRATVNNLLRLLKLPEAVQAMVRAGEISMGHARALLALPEDTSRLRLAKRIATEGLSVREVEAMVTVHAAVKRLRRRPPDHHVAAVEDELQQLLGTKVRIMARRNRGAIRIEFYSLDEFDRIVRLLRRAKQSPGAHN